VETRYRRPGKRRRVYPVPGQVLQKLQKLASANLPSLHGERSPPWRLGLVDDRILAEQLLADAGYAERDTYGYLHKDGQRLGLR
jgi:hypothetical protein